MEEALNHLRKLEAVARRWRGESMLLEKNYPEAMRELSNAARLAESVGCVRVHVDVQNALFRLHIAQGNIDLAESHMNQYQKIAKEIANSLDSSGLGFELVAN